MNYLLKIFLILVFFIGSFNLASERSREINFDKLPPDLKDCKLYKLIEQDFGATLVVVKCNNSSLTSTEITKNPLPTIVITSEM